MTWAEGYVFVDKYCGGGKGNRPKGETKHFTVPNDPKSGSSTDGDRRLVVGACSDERRERTIHRGEDPPSRVCTTDRGPLLLLTERTRH